MDAPLVFHWSDPLLERIQRIAHFFIALLLFVIPAALFSIFPIEQLVNLDWQVVWQKLSHKPLLLAQTGVLLVLYPLGLGVWMWSQKKHQKQARIRLDNETMRYESGLPWIGHWIDWTWDLDAIRSKKMVFRVVHPPLNSQPLRTYCLRWGLFAHRQMRPYVWQLPGQTVAQASKPDSFLGLVRWTTPANAALLQQQFDQLPLVAALGQRGITLPPISGKVQRSGGMDLMAQPRMRFAVWSFFVAVAAAFAMFHAMRHQHYFLAPASSVWIGMGVLAGFGVLAWLWPEQADSTALGHKKQLEFRFAQVMVASLFALAVGLCAPSLPLVLSSLVKPSQDKVFTLQKSPLLLRANLGSNTPDFAPRQALDYWASLPNGALVSLPVRQGFAGWWWQFDSSVLSDKLAMFYDAQQDQRNAKNR